MRGYIGISTSTSACLHFSEEHDLKHARSEIELATASGIEVAIFDARNDNINTTELMNFFGKKLNLQNPPYNEDEWVRFLDDMITKSYKSSGVVMIIDRAGGSVSRLDVGIFDFIESMMIQFNHWYNNKKPFHICIQITGSLTAAS